MVAERIVLRAELRVADRVIIGRTTRLSESAGVIEVADEAPLGVHVDVELSLAGLVDEPCAVAANLIARRLATGPGSPGTWELSWAGERDRQRLRALLEKLGLTPEPSSPLRVLLVEDSRMIREVFELGIGRLLRARRGALTLDCVADGESGWQRLRDGGYDVAIVDCLLPGIQGPELIRRLRDDGDVTQPTVVAISVGGEELRRSALDAGADIFIHKPVAIGDLLATLERLSARVES